MLFRGRRQRWALGRAAFKASAAQKEQVEATAQAMEAELLALRREMSELPGANPLCPQCGEGRMVMRSVITHGGWHKLWVCDHCGHKETLTDLPRKSVADVT